MPEILLEGFTLDEILDLPQGELADLILRDEPLVFKSGSATVLGKFKVGDATLFVELAHIDEGGEGALRALGALASRYAQREGLDWVEWRVHAVNCARPNLKLRRVLVRRGFEIRDIDGVGECYWQRIPADGSDRRRVGDQPSKG
jgi:hypothetical protein